MITLYDMDLVRSSTARRLIPSSLAASWAANGAGVSEPAELALAQPLSSIS